jgi:hypothetical protein
MTGLDRTLVSERRAQLAYMVLAVLSLVSVTGLWAYLWVH